MRKNSVKSVIDWQKVVQSAKSVEINNLQVEIKILKAKVAKQEKQIQDLTKQLKTTRVAKKAISAQIQKGKAIKASTKLIKAKEKRRKYKTGVKTKQLVKTVAMSEEVKKARIREAAQGPFDIYKPLVKKYRKTVFSSLNRIERKHPGLFTKIDEFLRRNGAIDAEEIEIIADIVYEDYTDLMITDNPYEDDPNAVSEELAALLIEDLEQWMETTREASK